MYIQLDLGNSLEMIVTRFSSKLPEETDLFARDFAQKFTAVIKFCVKFKLEFELND